MSTKTKPKPRKLEDCKPGASKAEVFEALMLVSKPTGTRKKAKKKPESPDSASS